MNGVRPKQAMLQLIEGDCLDYPIAGLPKATAVTGYKIVANLPYAVSTLDGRRHLGRTSRAHDTHAAKRSRRPLHRPMAQDFWCDFHLSAVSL